MKLAISKARKPPNMGSIIRERVSRTIRMLEMLQSGRTYNSRRLAEKLCVSRRTVYRDLRTLREAGIPVLVDECCEAYYVRAQREPGQIPVVYDQVVLLALAAHLSPLNCSRGLAAKIRSAISEMVSRLPGAMQMDVRKLLSRTGRQHQPVTNRVIDQIVRALPGRQPMQVLTEIERGVYANLEIVPHQLIASADGWKLLGQTSDDLDIRAFEVGSFMRVDVVECSDSLPASASQVAGGIQPAECRAYPKTLSIKRKTKLKRKASLPRFAQAG